MPKIVFIFIHLFVLLLSFSTICLGVLCVSTNSSICRYGNNELVVYCLLALGFFLLVTGIFWSAFHEVLKYRGLSNTFIRNPSHRDLHVSTIDRPDFYPTPYEDSTDLEKQTSLLPVAPTLKQQEVINIPPPPYSESSAEVISETDVQEQPPPSYLCGTYSSSKQLTKTQTPERS